MPLSEFLRMARGKLESSQLNEPFSRADDGLMELVWENGQIVMQGQSSNKASDFPSNPPRTHGPGLLHAPTKVTKFSEVESILDDISPVVPSGGLDLTQDDDMIRWLNCPIDDPLHQDYCSDLISEISGATATQETLLPTDKRTTCYRTFGSDLHGGYSTMKALSSSSKPCLGSGVSSDVITNIPSNNQGVMCASSARGKTVLLDDSMGRQNTQQLHSSSADLMNFSHFSKPAFLAKPNAPNSAIIPPNVAPSLPIKKAGFSEKVTYSSGKPAVVERLKEGVMVNSRQPMARENTGMCPNTERREGSTKQSEAASTSRREVSDVNEKIVEAVVVTSSVGSGNSADRFSYGQTQNSKRKFLDVDDSECRSDDVETESVGVKKTANARGGNGSKRSRAAEVHNLSERRRRDRINEKMRALQELIPNCNKADKASMLDEAIEYLKTLQLQVQMMSMGAGLCMPQMMYPHPTHFPPLMGMGMGYGINMHGGGSHMFPLSSVQGPHFPRIPPPCSNMPGYGSLGQGNIPNLVLPRPPQPPPSFVHPMNNGGAPHLSNTTATSHLNSSSSGRSGVPCSSLPSEMMRPSEDGGSMKHISSQQQAMNEGINESTKAVQENEQTTDKVHPSKNDNNKLCTPSSTGLNKEDAGCS